MPHNIWTKVENSGHKRDRTEPTSEVRVSLLLFKSRGQPI